MRVGGSFVQKLMDADMCGINGAFAYHVAASEVDRIELLGVRDRMIARGPDGEGLWMAPDRRVGLGHRRLTIIELSDRGRQPMSLRDNNVVITFNGEIYNFRALRKGLERRGHVFTSESDTEVLLHLYADRGEDMVGDLRGMFAFALWDASARKLILARDPFGIKPLYYADDGWTIRFASQARALLAGGGVSGEFESAGIVGFYLFGTVPEPFTLWRDIRAVPAGSIITVDAGGVSAPRKFCNLASVWANKSQKTFEKAAEGKVVETLRTALLDSVRSHLVADVPVGIFLSGGIDSGALLGLMRDVTTDAIRAITLSFDEFDGTREDEVPAASQTAALYNATHHIRQVTRQEFLDDLPAILAAMDQPSIDGINIWFAAKAAKEFGLKVALSGVGADELLGGYASFQDIPRIRRWTRAFSLVPGVGSLIRSALSPLLPLISPGLSPKAAGLMEYGGDWAGAWLLRRGVFMPWELENFLDPDIVAQGLHRLKPLVCIGKVLDPNPGDSFSTVSVLEMSLYMRNQLLRDTDWAGMAHGVEIRTPYVDIELLRIVPAGAILEAANAKRLLGDLPTKALPQETIRRPKTGFSIPTEEWLREALAQSEVQRHSGNIVGANSRAWLRQLWSSVDWSLA